MDQKTFDKIVSLINELNETVKQVDNDIVILLTAKIKNPNGFIVKTKGFAHGTKGDLIMLIDNAIDKIEIFEKINPN